MNFPNTYIILKLFQHQKDGTYHSNVIYCPLLQTTMLFAIEPIIKPHTKSA